MADATASQPGPGQPLVKRAARVPPGAHLRQHLGEIPDHGHAQGLPDGQL